MILTLSFVVGFAQSFGGPAYQALVPTLVDKEDLPNAVALNSIQFNLARVVGPVLAGIAFYKLGRRGVLRLERPLVPRADRGAARAAARRSEPCRRPRRSREPQDRTERGAERRDRCAASSPVVRRKLLRDAARDVPARSSRRTSSTATPRATACCSRRSASARSSARSASPRSAHVRRKGVLAVVMQMTLRRADGGLRALAEPRSFPTRCSRSRARRSWSSSRSS